MAVRLPDPHVKLLAKAYQRKAERAQPDGYCDLDEDGKVPAARLPAGGPGGAWGTIVGTLADQTDLQDALDDKADASHTHTQAESHGSPDTDSGTTALHHTLGTGANQAAAGNHTHAGVYDPAGTGATEAAAAVAAHAGAADPHTGYQKESEKNQASGYAGLSAGSKLDGTQQTYGSSASTACEGNDSRLSDARTPTAHTHDDRYYTEAEADALLGDKQDASVLLDNLEGAGAAVADRLLGALANDTPVWLTAAQVRTLLALVIGTNVQAYSANLTTLASSGIIFGNGAAPTIAAGQIGMWVEDGKLHIRDDVPNEQVYP